MLRITSVICLARLSPVSLLCATLLSCSAFAQPAFQGIGILPGGTFSRANGVSANGQYICGIGDNAARNVEGLYFATHHAPNLAGIGDLPGGEFRSQGWGISADGTAIVGQARSLYHTAYKWTAAGGMVGLGGLVPTSYNSSASAISGNGRFVVGWASTHFDPTNHGVRWDTAGAVSIIDLGDLPGGGEGTIAHAVSFDGSVVVGQSYSAAGVEAFRWTAAGGIVGLGDLPGGGFGSTAYGVSADGTIVVGDCTSATTSPAFRWTAAEGMIVLPPTASGGIPYTARAISADGSTIVGDADGGAFIWTAEHGTRLIADLLAAQGTPATGWTLYSARAVSADGCTIVGTGVSPTVPDGAGWIARLDRDGDGLLDCWEDPAKGIDADGDGTYDFKLGIAPHNANPDHKDIFVEFDAMIGMQPSIAALTSVRDAFAAAPVTNPDGIDGITLHSEFAGAGIDLISPRVAWSSLDLRGWPAEFDAFKLANFGTRTERESPNAAKILAAKRMAYRYCVFAFDFTADHASGAGEIGGNDCFITLGNWAIFTNTDELAAAAYMHELGHTLGLRHGGGQADSSDDRRYNFKPNYRSIMNYTWQFRGVILPPFSFDQFLYRASWNLDFSRSALPTINEAAVNEAAGLGGSATVFVPFGPAPPHIVRMAGAADFNGDGAINPPYAADANRIEPALPATPGDLLAGYNDWSNLKFSFRDNADFADGIHLSANALSELNLTQALAIGAAIGGCPADFNGDGTLDFFDYLDFIDAFSALLPRADFNGDGTIDFFDYLDFVDAFSAGC